MDGGIVVFLGIVILFLVFLNLKKYFKQKNSIKKRLLQSPLIKLSMFKDNEVGKIKGRIEIIGEPLIAPLTGRKCAYYQVIVEEDSSIRHGGWDVLFEVEDSVKYVLHDSNEVAWVDPLYLKFYFQKKVYFKSGFLDNPSKILTDFLIKNGYESTNFIGLNKTLRFKESILKDGDHLAVLGLGNWAEGNQMELPTSYKKVLHIQSNKGEPIFISDDPETFK